MGRFNEGDIVLKNYRIEKSIGQGAFGEVFLATHKGLNGKRAIKVLLRDDIGVGSSDYDEYRNRFRQESQLMEWFKDRHIVMVYDFQEEDNSLFLIMEYAAGGNLRQLMDQVKNDKRLMDARDIARIGMNVADGLASLHRRDVIHRDLKPSNILFDNEGIAKVADLGLAQIPGGTSMRSQLSVPKPHPGTPAYMSPEQEMAGSYLRPASDIYALGLILFEMVSSRSYKNLRPGTRVKSLVDSTPDWLDDLLARMLSESPKDRPWDGIEAADELRKGLEDGDKLTFEIQERKRRETEESARLKEQERLRQFAEEKSRIEAEEQAMRDAREQALRESKDLELRNEKIRAQQREEEKARIEAEEQAMRVAREQTLREENSLESNDLTTKIQQMEKEGLVACELKDWKTARLLVQYLEELGEDGQAAAIRLKNEIKPAPGLIWKRYSLAGLGMVIVFILGFLWANSGAQPLMANPTVIAKNMSSGITINTQKSPAANPKPTATLTVTQNSEKSQGLISPYNAGAGDVIAIAFSKDGKFFYTASSTKRITKWNAQTGDYILGLGEGDAVINKIDISSDGNYLALASDNHNVIIINSTTGELIKVLTGHTDAVLAVKFSPDNKLIASGSKDGTLRIWDLPGNPLSIFNIRSPVNSIAISAPNDQNHNVAIGTDDGLVEIWNYEQKSINWQTKGNAKALGVSFRGDGTYFVSAWEDGTVSVWDLMSNTKPVHSFNAGSSLIAFNFFSSSIGEYIATGAADGKINIFRINGQSLTSFSNTFPVLAVAISPDGKKLIESDKSSGLYVRDVNPN